MKPHLVQAHNCWRSFIQPGDTVVDATLGNGHDTLFLAHLLQGQGALVGYDIQDSALKQTQKRIDELPDSLKKIITLKLQSHDKFEESGVNLFVYNLGYLPGGNKSVTTRTETTLLSLNEALKRLDTKGAISITCYPGHPEGAREQNALVDFLKQLPSSEWAICHHVYLNRPLSPTWIWLLRGPFA